MRSKLTPTNTRTTHDLPGGDFLLIEGNEDDGVLHIWLNGNQGVTAEWIDEFQDLDWRKIRYDQKYNI